MAVYHNNYCYMELSNLYYTETVSKYNLGTHLFLSAADNFVK